MNKPRLFWPLAGLFVAIAAWLIPDPSQHLSRLPTEQCSEKLRLFSRISSPLVRDSTINDNLNASKSFDVCTEHLIDALSDAEQRDSSIVRFVLRFLHEKEHVEPSMRLAQKISDTATRDALYNRISKSTRFSG